MKIEQDNPDLSILGLNGLYFTFLYNVKKKKSFFAQRKKKYHTATIVKPENAANSVTHKITELLLFGRSMNLRSPEAFDLITIFSFFY